MWALPVQLMSLVKLCFMQEPTWLSALIFFVVTLSWSVRCLAQIQSCAKAIPVVRRCSGCSKLWLQCHTYSILLYVLPCNQGYMFGPVNVNGYSTWAVVPNWHTMLAALRSMEHEMSFEVNPENSYAANTSRVLSSPSSTKVVWCWGHPALPSMW